MKKLLISSILAICALTTFGQLNYKVRVPQGTKTVYLRGDMNSWGTTLVMNPDPLDDRVFTLNVPTAKNTHGYKYCSGPSWSYEELTSGGTPPGNRKYPGEGIEDVVAQWRMVYDPSIPIGNITLNVTVPQGTKNCYVVGSFNNWSWANPKAMTKVNETEYTTTVSNVQAIAYKYTSGPNSRYEEVKTDGSTIQDRTGHPSQGDPNPTLSDVVAKWKMQPAEDGDVLIDVLSLTSTPYMTVGGGKRTVRIYMPNDYKKSTERYPVLYMLDGQNIFSPGGTYGSWDIDLLLEAFHATGRRSCIIVGIDNSANRMSEYNPLGATEGTGANETTLPFIVHILKPYIDANYRTLPQREYTGLGGSSLGGLTAMWGVLQYQDIFSKGCVFSPSYWYNHPTIFDNYLHQWNRKEGNSFRIYQIGGTQEGSNMTDYMLEAYNLLTTQKGLTTQEIQNIASISMQHNEASWKAAFMDAFDWLWADYIQNGSTSVQETTVKEEAIIFSYHQQVHIQSKGSIRVMNGSMELIATGEHTLTTGRLLPGLYWVQCNGKIHKALIH